MEFSAEWRRVNGSAPGDMATAEGLQRPPHPRAARRRGGLRRGARFPRVLGAPPSSQRVFASPAPFRAKRTKQNFYFK